MKILLLGSQGQVGWELARSLMPLGTVVALGRRDLDLAQPEQLRTIVRAQAPQLIVNAAAYTAVDQAETDEATAFAVNAVAPGVLAEEAARGAALLIHYSTDYVFDGSLDRAYLETDATAPLSAYGRSKLAGEVAIASSGAAHLILRTSWVYGTRGHNFLQTMLRLARERETLRIVSDQMGAPTWSRWIADATADIARQAMQRHASERLESGIYNLTCTGATSWHGFAAAIIAEYRARYPDMPLRVKEIEPIATADYPLPATRPRNSRLDVSKLAQDYGIVPPAWQEALHLCMQEAQP